MAQLFARVELRGDPSFEIYQKLHAYMKSLNWLQTITGNVTSVLPHATYQAMNSAVSPDLGLIANGLKTGIETNIWTKAMVLVIQSSNWAQTAG